MFTGKASFALRRNVRKFVSWCIIRNKEIGICYLKKNLARYVKLCYIYCFNQSREVDL